MEYAIIFGLATVYLILFSIAGGFMRIGAPLMALGCSLTAMIECIYMINKLALLGHGLLPTGYLLVLLGSWGNYMFNLTKSGKTLP